MMVSFVIPTRNQAFFIRKCIDSCLAQLVPDCEIIVVDGLSTDGTQKILESYAGRIRWVSEKDSGQSEALNKGVRMARGDVIAWLNSDDYYASDDVLKKVVACFAGDPELDIVYGNGWMVDPAGLKFRRVLGKEISQPKDILLRPNSFVLQPALFFRKALFEQVGGVNVELHWVMDYDLWLRMFPHARKVRRVAEDFACAVYHPDAKSVRHIREQIAETVQLKRRYQADFQLSFRERLRLHTGILSLYVYWLAVAVGLKKHS